MHAVDKMKKEEFRELYRNGYKGMLILFVAVNLLGISGLSTMILSAVLTNDALFVALGWLAYANPHNVMKILAIFLTTIGLIICSRSFYRISKFVQPIKEFTKIEFNKVVGVFSIIVAGWLLFSEMFQLIGGVWVVSSYRFWSYWTSGPLFSQFVTVQTIGFILLGAVLILWATLFLLLRDFFKGKYLIFAAAIYFVIAASIILTSMLSYWVNGVAPWIIYHWGLPYWGFFFVAVFAAPACMLAAILFRRGYLDFDGGWNGG